MIYLRLPRYIPNFLFRLQRSGLALCLLILGLYVFYVIYGRTRLLFSDDELRRVWDWEVASGHYQSPRNIPPNARLGGPLLNPGIPANAPHSQLGSNNLNIGAGLPREYLDMQSLLSDTEYSPRPEPGSIADLDIIMDNCDFSTNKYVKDCLEFLSAGAGLYNGRRARRQTMDKWKYIYVEGGQRLITTLTTLSRFRETASRWLPNSIGPLLQIPPVRPYLTSSQLALICDPEHPRIFHIFWGGPFTSHPYSMILSFLYTQNLGLHLAHDLPDKRACRPELWIWIQTGPAEEANPKPDALELMQEELRTNPWSSPFLHPRFKDIFKFKLWNTTEQLDSTPELKNRWQSLNLFKSGGRVFHVPPESQGNSSSEKDLVTRMVPPLSQRYDRMRIILSDVARFVLCHRFGGIYLDADTILLRDWEELWGWKGAFAYRWSRQLKYNTAVMKLNKGSALGSFLINSALRNGLDFHPADGITNYINDAEMENLFLRLPDALFDPAWLNAEKFQRDRPPFPNLKTFEEFFEAPRQTPRFVQGVALGGFFSGAYSYHWHNNWWQPFDATRNWPDLGPRFADAERIALGSRSSEEGILSESNLSWRGNVTDPDLSWSALMKRTFEAYIRGERPNMYGEWMHL